MASVKEKLAGLDKTNYNSVPGPSQDINSELLEFDCQLVENQYGHFVLRVKRFPFSQVHGMKLENLTKVNADTFEFLSKEKKASNLLVSDLLFFDTETTGLAGGSGTYAFLVGIGYVDYEEIVVKQYFMRDFDAEMAMLSDLLDLFKKFKAIASFNGKSYDLPLLRNRFVLNRLKQDIDSKIHIDLLHPARRLWKNIHGDSSLQGLEKALLNFRRKDDIPGSLIPGKFFEYLQTKEFSLLKIIFQHNVMDILSMMSLLIIFDKVINQPEQISCQFDKIGLLKSYLNVHWIDRLLETSNNLLGPSKNKEDFDLLYFKSMVQKKYERKNDAATTWIELVEQYRKFDPKVYIELAMHYEHNLQEYDKAIDIVDRAIKRIDLKSELNDENHYLTELIDLKHRRKRIQKKKSKQ